MKGRDPSVATFLSETGKKLLPVLAIFAPAAALVPPIPAQAAPAQPTPTEVSPYATCPVFGVSGTPVSSGGSLGYQVTLTGSCGDTTIRAYVHCNGFPAGTYYETGGNASNVGGTSAAYCAYGDGRYGWSGYDVKVGGGSWTRVPLYQS